MNCRKKLHAEHHAFRVAGIPFFNDTTAIRYEQPWGRIEVRDLRTASAAGERRFVQRHAEHRGLVRRLACIRRRRWTFARVIRLIVSTGKRPALVVAGVIAEGPPSRSRWVAGIKNPSSTSSADAGTRSPCVMHLTISVRAA
jgi:hypothetical protein